MILNVITMVFKDIKGELWGIDRNLGFYQGKSQCN